ncbi:MAG: hypothetical protein UY48_C0002G0044 [Candidatus Gottesmanbacteria bacterium GW2011_GWB1_49_7]|uniref:Uncharacterized protein n=1 Tax=Candidatus Gottesmanbacteria bacterium GW2011_GWB1_49_7 TaxID=1618448 RepID=A0A0G1W3S2_9BACT|nr:MAG: hypothetical protein UY48_C0002G0044 [Candidatus Gottesmanbacteria bacterium GW2011_GWB1_49_7]
MTDGGKERSSPRSDDVRAGGSLKRITCPNNQRKETENV